MKLEQTWRWFGPDDRITLQDIKQTGANGIVTALHHIPIGDVWQIYEIHKLNKQIKNAGFRWSVVESIPIHEDIKRRSGQYKKYIDNYKKSIQNLGKCGLDIVCYNFIPILGWTRTDLDYKIHDGSSALRFDEIALAAFDLFILKRPYASNEYSQIVIERAKNHFDNLDINSRSRLTQNILAGLPGSDKGYTLNELQQFLDTYEGISTDDMKNHLYQFLEEIIPEAEKAGVKMAIHPDDPPFKLFGVPRILSTENDVRNLIECIDSPCNGLTFCTGSFGVRPDNDLESMISQFGHRIHFVHLRNVKRENGYTFHESNHLEGDVNMVKVLQSLIIEQQHRKNKGRTDLNIPMRPDHGHAMLGDQKQNKFPGYTCIGRLKGLAELRGLETGIRTKYFPS